MKTVAGIVSDVRYWLVIPSGFFFGILFGLYLGHYYQGSIPILHIKDQYIRLKEVNSTTLKDVVVIDDISNATRHLRLVCMIMTMPANRVKARAVQKTWAPRCDAYYFLSSVVDAELHSIAAADTEDRGHLWTKTKNGLHHAMSHYSDYDFFLKADDDTYTIVENLRFLLKDRDPEIPIIMGRRWRPHVKQGYLSGGGGYVMSRAALKLIIAGLKMDPSCAGTEAGGAEDVRLGTCAEKVGVKLVDSLDSDGYERFHPFSALGMVNHVNSDNPGWYKSYNYHKILTGYRCCSNLSVTFHYVSPEDMNLYEFFLYRLRLAAV